ncbi:MAG: glutathione S-transferase N-terminal domain-containing protein [Candidatus Accumulibacter sp.]|jgi:GST-like protein|nr:glutathione S-transferase N-terminal domain-containing protein [Accumulibacter sp.]
MVDLYFWPTANGIKIPMLLEELGIDYRPVALDIRAGAHKTEAFRKISPNLKIPVLVDDGALDGNAPVTVFESGAILLHLAEKHGRFLPAAGQGKAQALGWLFWQSAHVAAAFGQYVYFVEQLFGQVSEPLLDAACVELNRLYGVLETRLAEAAYLAGDYSIADIAVFPWIQPRRHRRRLADTPNLARWHAAVRARPVVDKAYRLGRGIASEEKVLSDWTGPEWKTGLSAVFRPRTQPGV